MQTIINHVFELTPYSGRHVLALQHCTCFSSFQKSAIQQCSGCMCATSRDCIVRTMYVVPHVRGIMQTGALGWHLPERASSQPDGNVSSSESPLTIGLV
jgi:hypothetical protein